MPDPCDLAQETIEQNEKIRERQRQDRLAKPKNISAECVDCDTKIPEGRQIATGGTDRCTFCADIFSKRNGGR